MFRPLKLSLIIILAATSSSAATLIHSYDFNSGTVTDTVGGMNGFLAGDANISNGVLVLDGVGDAVEISGGYAIPTIGNDFSVALRAQQTGQQIPYFSEMISQGRSNANSSGYGFYIGRDDLGRIRLGDRFPASVVQTIFPADSLWHSYVLTSGSGVGTRLFIDGIAVFSSALTMDVIPGGSNTRFGSQFSNPAQEFFRGNLDDIKIWNGVISADEVASYSNPSIVPLPASAPFLLAAVMAICTLRRRRSSVRPVQ